MENHNLFLKKKYNLHISPETNSAIRRSEAIARSKNEGLMIEKGGLVVQEKEGPLLQEKVPQDPSSRIQNYLDRFKEIIERKDFVGRERGLEAIKRILYRDYVIKRENIPGSYWQTQQRIAREQGHGNIEITDDLRRQGTEIIINDQKSSLDKWVDYLSSADAQYPDWAKYWAIRSVLEMGKLIKEEDKEGKEIANFQKRTKDTVAPFPTLNQAALAKTIGVLQSRLAETAKQKKERKPVENKSIKLTEEEFQALLSTENFSKIYTQFLIEIPEYSTEGLQETRGEWIKYNQGSSPDRLVKSLEGYALEWCTADFSTAQSQLQGGDFYVYYSLDQQGKTAIPRAAIRMQDNSIAEVRGIAPNQNLDPYIAPVVQKKTYELPGGETYEKKAGDMKQLTDIENKIKAKKDLSKDELVFLYEINSPIEGFGFQKDPRVKEFRNQRDPKVDAPIFFECDPKEIAWNQAEINENTKTYIGPLFSGIFTTYQYLDNIYTSFPEGKIRRESMEIGGKTTKQLEDELVNVGFRITDKARFIMDSNDFIPQEESKKIDTIWLKVADLFDDNNGENGPYSTVDIYTKARDIGLELCPAEVGPHLRLHYKSQPLGEWYRIAMKQIHGERGLPEAFVLERKDDGLRLDSSWIDPLLDWSCEDKFVFLLRK